jgi:8-hydroxy-5-deazaflavin:NADPH oxidoreductase
MQNAPSSGARRRFLISAGAAAAGLVLARTPGRAETPQTPKTSKPMKIGVIGSGNIGGTVGSLWVKAGHEVLFSSRHPDQLKSLVEKLGPRARAGWPKEAAAFGEVVLISVPYGAVPQIGRDFAKELAGKVVLETGNPYPGRDGTMALAARSRGTGLASKSYLPGVRLVRAFNSIGSYSLRSEAHRAGEKIGVPLAGDDKEALAVAAQLVRDAGFEPVIVGGLASAKEFDVGTSVYGQALTAATIRRRLGLK